MLILGRPLWLPAVYFSVNNTTSSLVYDSMCDGIVSDLES